MEPSPETKALADELGTHIEKEDRELLLYLARRVLTGGVSRAGILIALGAFYYAALFRIRDGRSSLTPPGGVLTSVELQRIAQAFDTLASNLANNGGSLTAKSMFGSGFL